LILKVKIICWLISLQKRVVLLGGAYTYCFRWMTDLVNPDLWVFQELVLVLVEALILDDVAAMMGITAGATRGMVGPNITALNKRTMIDPMTGRRSTFNPAVATHTGFLVEKIWLTQ
jgi:hypothetical protein